MARDIVKDNPALQANDANGNDRTSEFTKASDDSTVAYDNPAELSAEGKDCKISVSFSGSFPIAGGQVPNGPSAQPTKDGGFGFGFTVSGSVKEGNIAPDFNPRGWTLEQYVWNYVTLNGNVQENMPRAKQERLSGAPIRISGFKFTWYDHPGTGTFVPCHRNQIPALTVLCGPQSTASIIKQRVETSTIAHGLWLLNVSHSRRPGSNA